MSFGGFSWIPTVWNVKFKNDQHDQHVNTWTIVGPQRYLMCVYIYIYIHTGWWFQHPRKILVSWGCYSQYMEKQKLFQTTNQYIYIYLEIIPSTAAHHGLLSVKSPCVPCILHPSFHLHIFLQFSLPFAEWYRLCPLFYQWCPNLKMKKNLSRFSQDPPHFPRCFPGISMFF